jgi:carotenoid cleavage dioxygenase-like enzyme
MGPAFDASANPFLTGVFAPIQSELDETPLPVISGAVPGILAGTYFRNGPNGRFTPIGSYTYPLDGDGIVHAVRFVEGWATDKNVESARGDSRHAQR